jgi:hypothetical protein
MTPRISSIWSIVWASGIAHRLMTIDFAPAASKDLTESTYGITASSVSESGPIASQEGH